MSTVQDINVFPDLMSHGPFVRRTIEKSKK